MCQKGEENRGRKRKKENKKKRREGKEKREEAEVDEQSFKGSHSATAPVSKIVV